MASAFSPRILAWLREPLLHFAILGLAILLADRALAPDPAAARRIEVSAALQEQLAARLLQESGRPASAGELDAAIDRWVTEEVLYREGLAFGLDQGDAIIRDRVVQRMRGLVLNSAVVDPPGEAELRAWFDAYPERFDEPAQFDFVQMQVKQGEDEARRLAEALRRGLETGEGPVAPDGPLTEFRQRPRPNVVAMFDEGFAAALEALPEFEWHVVASAGSWHLVRLDGLWPAKTVGFEAARERVRADWEQSALAEKANAALQDLVAAYPATRAAPAPTRIGADVAGGGPGG